MLDIKSVGASYGQHRALTTINLRVKKGEIVVILGSNGAGKSTLLHMIAGSEPPTAGRVLRECRCSWPLGFAGSFQPNLTGIENILFAARVYGVDCDEAVAFAAEFAEIGEYIDMPVRTYSSGMKARLAFGLSLAIDFDIYLIDEITAVGDRRFQEKCRRAFAERTSKSGLCIVSHNEANIRTFCDIALVLHNGFLTPFEDIESALEYYASIMRFD